MNSFNQGAFTLRSIRRIDEEIRNNNNPSDGLMLMARKASALARHSLVQQARKIVTDLRRVNSRFDPRISAWIMFAEGVIEQSETLDNTRSRDKFIRAHLISQVAGDRSLAALTAAWVAHCNFVDGRLPETAQHLEKAFAWSAEEDSETRGRACMVLADAFNFGGAIDAAKSWYKLARKYAIADGDIAMQNTMLFNAAAFHISHLTLLDCENVLDPSTVKRAKLELASATNLNSALSINLLPSLLPLLTADVAVLEKRWAEAEGIYSEYIPSMPAEGQEVQVPKALAQRAWCRSNTGDFAGALKDSEHSMELTQDGSQDLDNTAIVFLRLNEVARRTGQNDLAQNHRAMGQGFANRYREQQREVIDLLQPIADSVIEKEKTRAKPGSD